MATLNEIPYLVIGENSQSQKKDNTSLGSDGWLSLPNCQFPQKVTLKLPKVYLVKVVRLQAHHLFIPKRVEIMVSMDSPPKTNKHARTVGIIELHDNSESQFKGRQKKAISTYAVGDTIILTLSQNHANEFNVNNQVALIEINLLGQIFDPKTMSVNKPQVIDNKNQTTLTTVVENQPQDSLNRNPGNFSTTELSLIRNPLIEIKTIIRLLKVRKMEAVSDRKYMDAKHITELMEMLEIAQLEMQQIHEAKHRAIRLEDFDKAEEETNEMIAIRNAAIMEMPSLKHYLTPAEKKALNFVETPTESGTIFRRQTNFRGRGRGNQQISQQSGRAIDKISEDPGNPGKLLVFNGPPPRKLSHHFDVEETESVDSRTCKFCGEQNSEFENETNMQLHHRKSCPCMMKCMFCQELVEVRKYTNHQRSECEFLIGRVSDCPKCNNPVTDEIKDKHLEPNSRLCNNRPPPPGGRFCPLCYRVVPGVNISQWRSHLIGPNACSGNLKRMKYGVGKVIQLPKPHNNIDPSLAFIQPDILPQSQPLIGVEYETPPEIPMHNIPPSIPANPHGIPFPIGAPENHYFFPLEPNPAAGLIPGSIPEGIDIPKINQPVLIPHISRTKRKSSSKRSKSIEIVPTKETNDIEIELKPKTRPKSEAKKKPKVPRDKNGKKDFWASKKIKEEIKDQEQKDDRLEKIFKKVDASFGLLSVK